MKPPLVFDAGQDLVFRKLVPWITVLTASVDEEKLLLGIEAGEVADRMRACAKTLAESGVRWTLVKGGRLEERAVDFLRDSKQEKEWVYEHSWMETRNARGKGSTLSAALAVQLAKGFPVPDAVQLATDYVSHALGARALLGNGAGPIHHFFNVMPRSVPLPTPYVPRPFTDYLIKYCGRKWKEYTFHEFPNGIGAGTLPLPSFLHFIQQDFHFLKQYARTHSLSAYKTEDMKEMAKESGIVGVIFKVTEMHIAYCEKYGITREQLMVLPESVTNIAYTRYVLETTTRGDLLSARVATAPCLIGYGEVGARLTATQGNRINNPYQDWINEYGGERYQTSAANGIKLLEETVAKNPISEERLEELAKIFLTATELEIAFWSAAVEVGMSETEVQDV